MKIKQFVFVALLIHLGSVSAISQQTATSAKEIMQNAYKQARKENKNLIVLFHASWCKWCHKMDSSMTDKSCRNFFQENYVICHLTVDEAKDKKNLETPGADEFRKKYHGENAGLPFWLIFAKDGNLLADSKIRPVGASLDANGESMGCPSTPEEVAYFVKLLKQTSILNDSQLKIIAERFSMNK